MCQYLASMILPLMSSNAHESLLSFLVSVVLYLDEEFPYDDALPWCS